MSNVKSPKIRFKGFTDDWEQRELGDIVNVYDGVHQTPNYTNSGVMFLSVEDITTLKSDKYISEEDFNRDYKIFPQQGDILMTRIGDIGTPNVVESTEKIAFYVSLALLKIKTGDPFFLCNAIQSPSFHNDLLKHSLTTAIPMKINKDEIGKVEIYVSPDLEEQKKIGSFFKNINNLITLHQRKYEKLKNIKQSMLEKMFPKNGEKFPEIRFKGFTDAWEQRKLGDHCDMYNGDRSSKYPNAQDMVPDGVPFINAGDLENGHVNLETCNKISREKYDELGGAKLQYGDIVYCLRGTLGKNAYIDNFTKGTIASSLVALRPKNIDGRYLFHILNSDIEYRQRIVHDEGAAQPNLSAKNLSNFILPIPTIAEQKKISKYFDNIDNLITLHQRKYEKLIKIKKSFLQKIFI